MCFVKQVHFGATRFNVLASPSDYDGAHTVFFSRPLHGAGSAIATKKVRGGLVCDGGGDGEDSQ